MTRIPTAKSLGLDTYWRQPAGPATAGAVGAVTGGAFGAATGEKDEKTKAAIKGMLAGAVAGAGMSALQSKIPEMYGGSRGIRSDAVAEGVTGGIFGWGLNKGREGNEKEASFNATVRRIAADPVKHATFQNLAPELGKFGALDGVFGKGKDITGAQKVLGAIAGTAIGSLIAATGSRAMDMYDAKQRGNPHAYEEEHKELGKIKARTAFRTEAIKQLQPLHTSVFKDLRKNDEIIAAADKKLVDSSYKTMTQFAPLLAADESAARSYLRTAIRTGIGPDYTTIKLLVESEQAAQQASGLIHR